MSLLSSVCLALNPYVHLYTFLQHVYFVPFDRQQVQILVHYVTGNVCYGRSQYFRKISSMFLNFLREEPNWLQQFSDIILFKPLPWLNFSTYVVVFSTWRWSNWKTGKRRRVNKFKQLQNIHVPSGVFIHTYSWPLFIREAC